MGPDALRGIGGDTTDVLRQAAVLGGALCYAANTILAKKLPELDPIVAAAGTMMMASAAIAPIALLRDAPWTTLASSGSLAAIVWLGVISTAVANIVYFALASTAGPTFLSFINYLIPGVALLTGIALLGEPFEWSSLAAFALILAGIYRGSDRSGQRGLEEAR
jgi:drug/metabolite transporter (DMT)-like permease